VRVLIVLGLALAGCSADGPVAPAGSPARAPAAPAAAVVTLDLDTAPGLSGLGVAADGALWTVAERDGAAYRIVLDHDRVASIGRVPLDPAPRADLESIEVVAPGRFAFGLETAEADSAGLAVGELSADGARIAITATTPLPAGDGRVVEANKGVEGVCGDARTLVVAFETVVAADGARFGQVEVHRDGAIARHRVRLTSATGKLAGVDCRLDATGADVLAIERHFEVTRLIAFRVPFAAAPAPTPPITPTLVRDLADLAAGRNFEGIARLPDGRIALVTDNQWRTIEGPSQLVVLAAPSGR